MTSPEPCLHSVPFREAARFWTKLGFINFGGPAGQIAIMHEEIVDQRKWVSNARFLHALNFRMLLPGSEAQQLAIYLGWLMHRVKGGLVAGVMFVLPSVRPEAAPCRMNTARRQNRLRESTPSYGSRLDRQLKGMSAPIDAYEAVASSA
jgi:hypothetical protein